MSAIPGFSTQKKLTTELGALPQDRTDDRSQFATLQKNFSDKVSLDATQIGFYKTNLVDVTIASVLAPPFTRRQLNIVGHGASEGDMIRFQSTSSIPGFEAKVNYVIDADNLIIAALLPQDPTVGDVVDILRSVTQRFGPDGTIQISIAPQPIIFVKDGVDTEVELDTVVPANSDPLPVVNLGPDGVQINPATEETALDILSTSMDILLAIDDLNFDVSLDVLETLFSDYGATPVTDAGWTELIASTSAEFKAYFLQESSGQPIELGIGALGLETTLDVIFPGGFNGQKPIKIPAGSRITARSLTTSPSNTAGTFIVASFLG